MTRTPGETVRCWWWCGRAGGPGGTVPPSGAHSTAPSHARWAEVATVAATTPPTRMTDNQTRGVMSWLDWAGICVLAIELPEDFLINVPMVLLMPQ